jgi:hypothetical protein
MTSQQTSSTIRRPATPRPATRSRTTRQNRSGSSARPAPMAATQAGTLRGIGRFVALAANPVGVSNRAVGRLLTALVVGGIWTGLAWFVAPATKHVTAHTPNGTHELTVGLSRWPSAIAIACVLGMILMLIAGVRLQRSHDRQRLA